MLAEGSAKFKVQSAKFFVTWQLRDQRRQLQKWLVARKRKDSKDFKD